MGAYLSKPLTDKTSSNFTNEKFAYGVSGMQGWRVSMEDAHNCIPDLEENSSLFAVYDGHGGNEVALYCAYHFGDVLKENENYKKNALEEALSETFLKLDELVVLKETILELKVLADRSLEDGPPTEEDFKKKAEEEVPEENETELLHEEATMNIEELLKRYGQTANAMNAALAVSTGENEHGDNSNSSKSSKEEEVTAIDNTNNKTEENCSSNKKPETASSTEEVIETENAVESIVAKEKINNSNSKSENVEDSEKDKEDSGTQSESKVMKKVKEKVKPAKLSTPDEDYAPPHDSDSESEESFDSSDAVGGSDDDSSEEEEEEEDDNVSPDMVNEVVSNNVEEPGKDSGTTAVVALIKNKRLIVANAGDSRCVLSRAEGVAFDMSDDHKPENEPELGRIKLAGGHVNAQGRVNGGLNLSRAIGDHCYKTNENFDLKNQMITALPDIRSVDLKENDEFMVLACDGIWNVLSSQEVVDFVRCRLDAQKEESDPKLSTICEELFTRCMAPDTMGDGTGCDNMTCIIVKFNKDWLAKEETNGVSGDGECIISSNTKTDEKVCNDENDIDTINVVNNIKRNISMEVIKEDNSITAIENPSKRTKFV